MENNRILNASKKPLIVRGIVIGGLLGFVLSITILFGYQQLPPGEGPIFLVVPWVVSVLPTLGIYKLFGWAWRVCSVNEVPAHVFWSVVFVNSVLCALLGGISGYLIALAKRRKHSISRG
jgi:hypothetical protein